MCLRLKASAGYFPKLCQSVAPFGVGVDASASRDVAIMHYLAGAFQSACRPLHALISGDSEAGDAPPAALPKPAAAEAPPTAAPTTSSVTDPAEVPERDPVASTALLDDEVLLSRYELHSIIGRGGYSVVWRGTKRASGSDGGGGAAGRPVAIKRVVDAFRNEDDAKRSYREVALQRQCSSEHILPIESVLRATNGRDAYLVTPCISPTSRLHLAYISPTPRLYLACISPRCASRSTPSSPPSSGSCCGASPTSSSARRRW